MVGGHLGRSSSVRKYLFVGGELSGMGGKTVSLVAVGPNGSRREWDVSQSVDDCVRIRTPYRLRISGQNTGLEMFSGFGSPNTGSRIYVV